MIRKLTVVLLTGVICLLGITSALAVTYNEAPMLRTMVAAGELPPVEERLPEEPKVLKPFEEIGRYGGLVRFCVPALRNLESVWHTSSGEPLLLWDVYKTKIFPNVAKSWTISEDGKTFTFYLRKGMKWSDGAPFTADDIMFWYEDVLLNKDLYPSISWIYRFGGEVMKVEKVDDCTVQFKFVKPFGLFEGYMANLVGPLALYLPKHYMKQFHPRYVSKEKLEKMAKEAGFEHWYELFRDKVKFRGALADLPTIRAWKVTADPSAPYFLAERNPYYWKVDTAGNQLPYIDKWRGEIVDIEIGVMRAIAGEIDFDRNVIAEEEFLKRRTLFMANKDKGGYRIMETAPSGSNQQEFYFNLTYEKDPVLRDIFRNKKFRVALSLGVDREEISELVFDGLGEPSQGHGFPGSSYYVESVDKANTEYDPKKANNLLDEIGLKRDAEGIRLRPDGKPLQLLIETGMRPPRTAELIADHWTKDLGIKTMVKSYDWALMYHKSDANELQIFSWWGIWDVFNPFFDQYHYQIMKFGPLWYEWLRTEGEAGEEPPADVKRLHKIMKEEGYAATSENERIELLKEVMKLWSDNQWWIGTVVLPAQRHQYGKKNLRNIPFGRDVAGSWFPGGYLSQQLCQIFWKK